MKILLMDEHALFRAGMHYVLCQMDEQADANSLQATLECAEQNPDLDLALLDLSMPDNDGLTSVKVHLAAVFQALRVNNRMEAVHAGQRFGLIPD